MREELGPGHHMSGCNPWTVRQGCESRGCLPATWRVMSPPDGPLLLLLQSSVPAGCLPKVLAQETPLPTAP